MAKPSHDEIQEFFKSWWLSNYMVPLNKTPMGMVEFISAFYASVSLLIKGTAFP